MRSNVRAISSHRALLAGFSSLLLLSACAFETAGTRGIAAVPSKPIVEYCPYLPSKTFSGGVTVSGDAYYEYRTNGNGEVSDSKHVLTASAALNYSVTINGTAVTANCGGACTAAQGAAAVATAVNANSALPVTASYTSGSSLTLSPKTLGDAITVGALSNLSDSAHGDPNPIRYAEVRVTDPAGVLVQCAETDGNGDFTFQLPNDSRTYTITVSSRAYNTSNTAFVMNDPTNNEYHKIQTTIVSTGSPTARLIAKATSTLEGGAFNILDQILNAQTYLRTQTVNCSSSGSGNYFAGCTAFTTAPTVLVYWKAGFNPGEYFDEPSGPISYYLNGTRQLFILGGSSGDTDRTDMDHYDNSIIIHEYAHFLEDQFGVPNSPGGAHNGNSVIDPRLAWGEGWANFFQAAVTGVAVYRDTYGHVGCTGAPATGYPSCYGVSFNVNLDLDGTTCSSANSSCIDKPTAAGEGNFREFSITRLLWDVVKPGGTSQFSEIWTTFHSSPTSMKNVSDSFKSIGRFHKSQQSVAGAVDWSTPRGLEHHASDLSGYATPFTTTGCASTSAAMDIVKVSTDNGSFATSNLFKNNDFYVLNHAGGALSLNLTWSGAQAADLDLYIYKSSYAFGTDTTMAGASATDSNSTSGSETVSGTLAAGQYLINVFAYTGIYSATGTYSTTYNLTINGSPLCPSP